MKSRLLTFPLAFALATPIAIAGEHDWPQWRGPNRDGHAAPQDLLKQWPDGGPDLKWQVENVGRGYSTVSIVDGHLYTMGARDGDCLAICLAAASGDLVWEKRISRAGTGDDYNVNWGAGPRSTPTIDGNQVFLLSDIGELVALYLATDQDREGEAISLHLYELLKEDGVLGKKDVHRVVFNEVTKRAIREAIDNPRELSNDLINAQQARRALDYLVGFNLSPLLRLSGLGEFLLELWFQMLIGVRGVLDLCQI